MKTKIVILCCLICLSCIVAQGEKALALFPFFDFDFGMSIETVKELLSEEYGIESTIISEDSTGLLQKDAVSLVPVDSLIRFGGYPFVVNFVFISNKLSAVSLYNTNVDFINSPYVWTSQDLYLYQMNMAAQYADIIKRMEYQYGEPTEKQIVSLGESIANQWLFPNSGDFFQDMLSILQREDYVYIIVRISNIHCYLTQTTLKSGMPFCSIIITYGKDSSKQNLPLSLQEFEAYNGAYFFGHPSETYPIPKEIVPLKPEDILFEAIHYLGSP